MIKAYALVGLTERGKWGMGESAESYVPHKSIFTIMEVYDAPSTFKCHSVLGCKRDGLTTV